MSKKVLYREYDEEEKLIKLECSKCGEIKEVNCFCKNKNRKDGVNIICSLCMKKYYEYNKEKISKIQAEYQRNNKEKINEYHREYRKNNQEKVNEYHREYRKNNQEKENERQRQYRENNIDRYREYEHKYRENNREKVLERLRKYRENNREKIHESAHIYRENNRDKIHQHYIDNKDKIREEQRIVYINKSNKEIQRIYENITKNLYPNNGIQYGIIYGVHCKVTNRWYIGQTVRSFNLRYNGDFLKNKFIDLYENNSKCKLLQSDIEKYGKESFEIFEVLDVAFSEKELDEKEAYYIDYYKAYDEGYNSNRGNIFKHNKSKRKEVI